MASLPTPRAFAAVAFACLLLIPTGAAAAVGTPADSDDRTTSADDALSFVRTVEEMKGHLTVSVQYAQDGNAEMAAHHAGHPYEEYWSAVNATLRDANATLAADLETALQNAPDHARNDSASAYADYVNDTLFPLFDDAKRAVAGDSVTDAAFNAKVSRDLLQRAVQEYGEGVAANGTIVEQMEYDDGHGFALRAQALYEAHVRSTLDEGAADELDEMYENLLSAIAAAESPEDVEGVTNGIASEYAEYVGIESEVEGSGAAHTVAEIEEHLHEAVEAYENGNPDEAKEIIRQTYLSYFEGLEGDLIEKRPELVEELETDFNEDLPGLIEENASVSEVHEKVESMEEKLDTVATVLSEENETTISLGDEDTTTTGNTSESSGSTPGFGVGAALVALLAAALAFRRTD